jgi:predicted deacetylase
VPPSARRTIAVALHDIEPATFERCALIRDWLDDHGVDRVTLLVIPARDLHPLGERSPEMVQWLAERRRAGDSIAQHGFRHERLRRPGWYERALAPVRAGRAAEFVGLDDPETRRAVEAGWRLLKLAGIEPDGFVAPAYAYTPALRRALSTRFRWWASLLGLHGTPERSWRQLTPAWSPTSVRAGALLAGRTLRLDLHPAYLDHPRHMLALEWALGHTARRRLAVTCDRLAGVGVRVGTPLPYDISGASAGPASSSAAAAAALRCQGRV